MDIVLTIANAQFFNSLLSQKDYSMGPNFTSALILTAMNKYEEDVAPFLALSRETWGEEILWDAAKDVQYGAAKRTRLMYAAKIGDLARVTWLLKRGADVNVKDARGKTALYYACENGDLEIVRQLLLKGAKSIGKHEVYTKCSSPLHAAIKNKHLVITELLLNSGFCANAVCRGFEHPLGLTEFIPDKDERHKFKYLLQKHGSLWNFAHACSCLKKIVDL